MHGRHTIGYKRRLYTREDGLTEGFSSLQRFYFLLVSPEITNDTNYRIMATMSGHSAITSQPFTISHIGEEGPGLSCFIASSKFQFYTDESFFVEEVSRIRTGLEDCVLDLYRVEGAEITRVRGIPTNCSSSTTIAEVNLNGLNDGLYFLRLQAYVPSYDRLHRTRYSADTRRFRVVERSAEPVTPTSVIDISEPVDGIRWILGNNVPVRWNIVSGWQDGDRVVCRLLRSGTEVHRQVRWTRNGSTQLSPRRTSHDSEGDYRVIVEHHRNSSGGNDILITSEERTIHYIYDPNACTDDRPVHIIDVRPEHGVRFVAGGAMRIVYCHRSAEDDPHIRVVLKSSSTEEEWVLGDRISTRSSSGSSLDLTIPSDVPPGTGYNLYIYEVEGSAQDGFDYALEISAAP